MLTCGIVRPKYQELCINKWPPLGYNKTSRWTTTLVTSVFPDHRQHKGGRVSFESFLRDFNASWQEGSLVEAQGGGTWQCNRVDNREGMGKGLIDNLWRSPPVTYFSQLFLTAQNFQSLSNNTTGQRKRCMSLSWTCVYFRFKLHASFLN